MNTTLEDLFGKTLQSAQRVLDNQDPGYTITLAEDHTARIYDDTGSLCAKILSDPPRMVFV